MHDDLRASGIVALLKSDIAGLSDRHLWKIVERIELATSTNPLGPAGDVGKRIAAALKSKGKSLEKFLAAAATRRDSKAGFSFQEPSLMELIEQL